MQFPGSIHHITVMHTGIATVLSAKLWTDGIWISPHPLDNINEFHGLSPIPYVPSLPRREQRQVRLLENKTLRKKQPQGKNNQRTKSTIANYMAALKSTLGLAAKKNLQRQKYTTFAKAQFV